MSHPDGAGGSDDVTHLVRDAAAVLGAAGIETPRVDAELLLAHAAGVERGDVVRAAMLGAGLGSLSATPDALPAPDVAARFADLVALRATRVPLQHLTGTAPFRHLELSVGPGVFVPRPETEQVAQVAIDEARAVVAARGGSDGDAGRGSDRGPVRVVDLCTGSGAIALAVATEVAGTEVHAVELDRDAFAWAERNVAAVGGVCAGPEDGAPSVPPVRLVRGDARTALADLDGSCDVVVSNPPYVPSGAVPKDPEVAEHDPAVALYGLGADGLEVPRGVTAAAARLLRPGGLYVMEHAEVQAQAAREMVAAVGGFVEIRTEADLTGRPRMVVARRARSTEDPISRPPVKDWRS